MYDVYTYDIYIHTHYVHYVVESITYWIILCFRHMPFNLGTLRYPPHPLTVDGLPRPERIPFGGKV